MVFKNKKLIGYFLADKQSSYFQSPKFEQVIRFVTANPNRVQLRERNERLSLVFTNISTLEKAVDVLDDVMSIETSTT